MYQVRGEISRKWGAITAPASKLTRRMEKSLNGWLCALQLLHRFLGTIAGQLMSKKPWVSLIATKSGLKNSSVLSALKISKDGLA